MLGSSSLWVPLMFPNGEVASRMAIGKVVVSASRVNQLVTIYWDGIDEGAISPIIPNSLNGGVTRYLVMKGVPSMEAAGFVTAMTQISDRQWLLPSWSFIKSITQDATGTGYTGSGGSQAFNVKKLAYLGLAGLALVYGAPLLTPILKRVLK